MEHPVLSSHRVALARVVTSFLSVLVGLILCPAHVWAQSAPQGQDIGAVGLAGSDSVSGTVITVTGAGADIADNADAFHFRYQSLDGDGSLVVQIPSAAAGHAWAKMGLMIRGGLNPDSPEIMAFVTPAMHLAFQYRTVAGGTTTTFDAGYVRYFPAWLWLDRHGDDFKVFQSTDGDQWSAIGGTVTIPMPVTSYFGLAVTSHDATRTYTANFDHYDLIPGVPNQPDQPPRAPTNLRVVANPTASTVKLAWTDNSGDEDNFEITRVIGTPGQGYGDVTFTVPANTTTYEDTTAQPGIRYSYTVRADRFPYASPIANAVTVWTATANAPGWIESGIGGTTDYGYSYTQNPDSIVVASQAGSTSGTEDRGRLLCRWWSGDGVILARASMTTNNSTVQRCGLMFRQSGAPDAPFVALEFTGANGSTVLASRETAGGAVARVSSAAVMMPCWMRVTRAGNVFTGELSPDGITWNAAGSVTTALGANVLVGLYVSGDGTYSTTATFDHAALPDQAVLPPVTAPADLTSDASGSREIHLRWTDRSSDETSFELERRDYASGSFYRVLTLPAGTVAVSDVNLYQNNTYTYRIRAVRNGYASDYSNLLVASTRPAYSSNWTGVNIGSPSSGSATVADDGSNATVGVTGGDIDGTADNFQFGYRLWQGDGTFVARVASLTSTDPAAKAGLMIRSSFAEGSPHAAMLLTTGQAAAFELRTSAGGATETVAGPSVNPPYWVKLNRTGNVLTGYVSPDGATWTQVGSRTVALGTDVYVGVVATAHNATAEASAQFDQISCSGGAAQPPAAPSNLVVTEVTATSARLSWLDNMSDETGYEIFRYNYSDGVVIAIGTVGPNTTTYVDPTLEPGYRYYYYVRSLRGAETSAQSTAITFYSAPGTGGAPANPTTLQIDGPTVSTLRLSWTDNSPDETGFEVYRQSPTYEYRLLATVPANATSFTDTNLKPDTTYMYTVRAVRNGRASLFPYPAAGRTQPVTVLGSWTGSDIGSTYTSGSGDSGAPPAVTLTSGGYDIWGSYDQFRYYYRTVSGDATIVARVASLTNTHPWAKAGVMMRASLAGGDMHVAVLLTAGNAVCFEVRSAVNASTTLTTGPWVNAPYWVKLTRSGNNLSGFISPDGTNWTSVGTATVTLPASTYIGVATSPHAYVTGTAAFDNLVVTGSDAPPPVSPPAAPTNPQISNVTASSLHLSWVDHSDNEDGFEIYRGTGNSVPSLLTTVAANVTGYDDTGLSPDTSYSYYVRAFLGSQRSSPYYYVSATTLHDSPTPPNAPTGLQAGSATMSSLQVTWVDASNDETGFVLERATGSGAYAVIANIAANVTSFNDTGLASDTAYSYRLRATKSGVYSGYSNVATARTLAMSTPPPGAWASSDIGTTGSAGSDSGSPPTVTMNAGGADIYGTSDSFRGMFQTVTGDTTIVAHVASLTNTNSWAKAGVMIRTSLDATSANAAMLLSPDQVCSFQTRASAGAATTVTNGAWVTPPYWVKLTRVGITFTGFVSPDGATWTQVATADVAMPAQVYIGLAACSHNTSAQTVASFDHVAIASTDSPPPAPATWTGTALGSGTGSFTAGATTMSIDGSGEDFYESDDAGEFVYQPFNRDGTFIARVDSITDTNPYAKAGLMLRSSTSAIAPNVLVCLTAERGAFLQYRPSDGYSTTIVGQNGAPAPGAWIKLVRSGTTVTGYWSFDGAVWSLLGSVTIDLGASPLIGFAVSSHNTGATATVVFSNMSGP